MAGTTTKNVDSSLGSEGARTGCSASLVELYKAFKAMTFYPEGHPLRGQILLRSHQALLRSTAERELAVLIGRTGLSLADREEQIEQTRLITALARELFAREIQRLTFLPNLGFDQFTTFLDILSYEPQRISAEGGMARLLTQRGVHGVITNEIDIAAVFTRKSVGESGDGPGTAAGGAGDVSAQPVAAVVSGPDSSSAGHTEGVAAAAPPDRLEELTIGQLLAAMAAENDDGRYRRMAFLLTGKGQSLKLEKDFDGLFVVLLELLNHNAETGRSELQRQTAMMTFRELGCGIMVEHLLDHLQDALFCRQERVYLVLHHCGAGCVDAIVARTAVADSEPVKKNLLTALLRIGVAAVPVLQELLQNATWQVARVAAAVLGELGSRDGVPGLAVAARQGDVRVRNEAIRSLARIGGREATETLVDLVRDENRGIGRQAILWLGISRNEKAVQPLLELVLARDLFCKSALLKKEALLALGRIGDRRVVIPLCGFARKRRLLAADRWQTVQVVALETLARLGGHDAAACLSHLARRRGSLGTVCRNLLASLEPVKESDRG